MLIPLFKASRLPSLYAQLKELFRALDESQIRLGVFFTSLALSVVQVFVNLTVWLLLFPLMAGIFANDFTEALRLPALAWFVKRYPVVASSWTRSFIFLVASAFTASTLKSVLSYVCHVLLNHQTREVERRVRMMVFERALGFGNQFFSQNPMGRLVTTMDSCVHSINEELVGMRELMVAVLSSAVLVWMMANISWQATLAAMALYPILYSLTRLFVNKVKSTAIKQKQAISETQSRFLDVLNGITIVKGYGAEEKECARFFSMLRRETALAKQMDRVAQLVEPIQELGGLSIQMGIACAINLIGSHSGTVAPHQMVLFLYFLLRLSTEVRGIENYSYRIARNAGARAQVKWLMDASDKHVVTGGTVPFCGLRHSIQACNLSFGYRPDQTILNGLNFEMKRGQRTALIGHTGAGKTTLCNLILRLFDCAPGSLFIDGRDVREFELKSLRRSMAFVSQDTFLFHDTIRANLCYGSERFLSDAELLSAMQAAQLDTFLAKLPDGLDTVVGERGASLSGGEKQRLSIARALLKDAQILVLDEPTSALDLGTEGRLLAALDRLTVDRTVIVIAHRPATIRTADHIVLLEHGHLVAQGNFFELRHNSAAFAHYWKQTEASEPLLACHSDPAKATLTA